jgi:hypothetical protein
MLRRSATSFESIVPDKDEKIYEKWIALSLKNPPIPDLYLFYFIFTKSRFIKDEQQPVRWWPRLQMEKQSMVNLYNLQNLYVPVKENKPSYNNLATARETQQKQPIN